MLDYGCGPVIANVISAAGIGSDIILAEYTEKSRQAIQQWLDSEPSACMGLVTILQVHCSNSLRKGGKRRLHIIALLKLHDTMPNATYSCSASRKWYSIYDPLHSLRSITHCKNRS